MTDISVLYEGRMHFGDNAGHYKDAFYAGLSIEWPCRINIKSAADPVVFEFSTSHIETYETGTGHGVFINGREIGRLRDPNSSSGEDEMFKIPLTNDELLDLLNGTEMFILKITIDQGPGWGLIDDFLLRKVALVGARCELGWARARDREA